MENPDNKNVQLMDAKEIFSQLGLSFTVVDESTEDENKEKEKKKE